MRFYQQAYSHLKQCQSSREGVQTTDLAEIWGVWGMFERDLARILSSYTRHLSGRYGALKDHVLKTGVDTIKEEGFNTKRARTFTCFCLVRPQARSGPRAPAVPPARSAKPSLEDIARACCLRRSLTTTYIHSFACHPRAPRNIYPPDIFIT